MNSSNPRRAGGLKTEYRIRTSPRLMHHKPISGRSRAYEFTVSFVGLSKFIDFRSIMMRGAWDVCTGNCIFIRRPKNSSRRGPTRSRDDRSFRILRIQRERGAIRFDILNCDDEDLESETGGRGRDPEPPVGSHFIWTGHAQRKGAKLEIKSGW